MSTRLLNRLPSNLSQVHPSSQRPKTHGHPTIVSSRQPFQAQLRFTSNSNSNTSTSKHAPNPQIATESTTKPKIGQKPEDIRMGGEGFSMKDLGATPTVRTVVYVFLGAAAILESYAWYQWGRRKWFAKYDVVAEDDD